MLNVSFSNPMGYVIVTQKHDGKVQRFRNDLCFANIKLFAEIEHYQDEYRLHMFFSDNDHLKRIIKAYGENAKYFLADRHYHFNSFYRAVNQTTIEYLNQLGAKVSFFYKKPTPKH